jgi:heme exporter protein A
MDGFSGQGLTCIRSERIVFEGLDFEVEPGGALVLTGPNGSGKSSLLRLMAGIARPAAGAISWNGAPVRDDPEAFFSMIHYLGHRDAVKSALTVSENLAFHAALKGGAPRAVIEEALDRVGLLPLAHMPARMLSAGQTRRLSLARLLAVSVPLWLLDEPTIALDPPSVSTVASAIAGHRANGGIVVASTNVPLGIANAREIDMGLRESVPLTPWGDSA